MLWSVQKRPADSSGGHAAGYKRPTFNPPKRMPGRVLGGPRSGAGPVKAGNAESGAGVLAALERTMHIPAAMDVAGILDCGPHRGGSTPLAAASASATREARLAQQRAARAADDEAMYQACCMAPADSEMGSCAGGPWDAGGAGMASSAVNAEGGTSTVAEALAMLAEIKKTMPTARYQQV